MSCCVGKYGLKLYNESHCERRGIKAILVATNLVFNSSNLLIYLFYNVTLKHFRRSRFVWDLLIGGGVGDPPKSLNFATLCCYVVLTFIFKDMFWEKVISPSWKKVFHDEKLRIKCKKISRMSSYFEVILEDT